MISAQAIKKSLVDLGYRGADLHSHYQFAAVDLPSRDIRSVHVAAFLDGPASYKTAALAVVNSSSEDAVYEDVANSRSLGAPYLIVLTKATAAAWTYTLSGPAKLDEVPVSQWEALLQNRQSVFSASAVRALKFVKVRDDISGEASLFDPATLHSIQVDTQTAVHDLLQSFLSHFQGVSVVELSLTKDYRVLFPMVFRLLAAKILLDRQDSRFKSVDVGNVENTLSAVEKLYSLEALALRWNAAKRNQLTAAWRELRDGLFVRNVAADDLAFVYEQTLITPEIRRDYGTHSTPPSVAEYVVRSFNLPDDVRAQSISVYEPFAGSCVFLTAALRRFQEILPGEWSPKRTHEHLVKHFRASEIDQFACEIARLSLILADYPNHNGWRIENEDLFQNKLLVTRASNANIVVCNPPFEDFEGVKGETSIHKPLAALEAILQSHPDYLGVVMPDGLSTHKKYRAVLESAVRLYSDVEVLKLPEGSFRHAAVGAEVLIAQQPRRESTDNFFTTIRRSEVLRGDLPRFERSLQPTNLQSASVDPMRAPGLTGLRPLRDLWTELSANPRLGDIAEVHRGLEWGYEQATASRSKPTAGFREGLHRFADGGLKQFAVSSTIYLDCRASKLRGGAINLPWTQPKVICNAVRTSRGPWRLAAAVDEKGLVASQQFFGIWLRESDLEPIDSNRLHALAGVINSPLANAFSFCHDSQRRLLVGTMEEIPLPRQALSSSIGELIEEYGRSLMDEDCGPLFRGSSRAAASILMEIDALILAAFDLPPRLERELLRLMSADGRPCRHDFPPYPGISQNSGALPLASRLSISKQDRVEAWKDLSKPLANSVANVFELI
ncbi:SAM-dependent DNA methyltransferase [bacterium M00.F.Ca.ET.228.01.1.1]|nr:SAM-dependent DNA methyltransferase [bacterium M00.F.Ca.ET.228.01.1.1]TGS02788.1 SAM-dependent DNA methyltransferase [bacterium M00.F.Ca.ET.191.01.1.1]TGU06170.1 SAM-dependent DNA methyltransferase [bacterium M00.F.Ca.ET.155.01.1.1]